MQNNKKVLFFLPSGVGGAERMTVSIAKMLPLDKFDVKFVIVNRSLGAIVDFIPPNYEIIHIPIHNIYCATTLRMLNVIRKEKPCIVFCSILYLNARLIVAAKLAGVKVIVRNNIDLSRTPSKINPILVKTTYRWADKVIAQQEEMHDEIVRYTNLPDSKVITLHNPIDIEEINKKALAPSPFTDNNIQIKYVWVGRFSRVKGQDIIVEAFEKLRKSVPNAHLYLVGKYDVDSIFFASVRKFVSDRGLKDYVHFVGFDTNPYRWMKYCDCYVMPSRLEGLPNSLIEAMYLGKPVVATKCIPIVSRIVKDGYNGILVETENIDSLAQGMKKALELKNYVMTYKPASQEDFCKLFA